MQLQRLAVYSVGVAAIIAAGLFLRSRSVSPVARLRDDIAAVRQGLADASDSLSDGALYQRHKAVHDAIQTMRSDLLRLVAAESAFTADSGRPTSFPMPPYWTGPSLGVVGPTIQITRNGWWATVTNTRAAIACAVVVGPDTAFRNAPPGRPTCFSMGH